MLKNDIYVRNWNSTCFLELLLTTYSSLSISFSFFSFGTLLGKKKEWMINKLIPYGFPTDLPTVNLVEKKG